MVPPNPSHLLRARGVCQGVTLVARPARISKLAKTSSVDVVFAPSSSSPSLSSLSLRSPSVVGTTVNVVCAVVAAVIVPGGLPGWRCSSDGCIRGLSLHRSGNGIVFFQIRPVLERVCGPKRLQNRSNRWRAKCPTSLDGFRGRSGPLWTPPIRRLSDQPPAV